MQIRTILYQYIKTLIKHVFLLNVTYELLMSFRNIRKKLWIRKIFQEREENSQYHLLLWELEILDKEYLFKMSLHKFELLLSWVASNA